MKILWRANVNWFARLLVELTEDRTSNSSQTDSISSEQVCEMTEKNSVHEKSYMLVNLWNGIEEEEYKINMIFMFISNLKLAAQSDVFSLLGNLLNQEMFKRYWKKGPGYYNTRPQSFQQDGPI